MKEFKQMYYFETSSVQPTVEDADSRGQVLAFGDGDWTAIQWTSLQKPYQVKFYTHWAQMPKSPCEEEQS